MINVNINEVDLKKMLDKNYILEHDSNMLVIRNSEGKPLAEVIYFEEINEILAMTEKEFVWCKEVKGISTLENKIYLDLKLEGRELDWTIKTRDI